MRVLRRESPEKFEAEHVFRALHATRPVGTRPDAVWLDSGRDATVGGSFIGTASRRVTASVADHTITVDGVVRSGTIFDFLRSLPADVGAEKVTGFPLGWVGWLGYELRAQTMGVNLTAQSRYPDAGFVFIDRGVSFDHTSGQMSFIALGDEWTSDLDSWFDSSLETLRRFAESVPNPRVESAHARWRYTDEAYLAMVGACLDAIREGEAYQLCVTSEAVVDTHHEPLSTYLALRESSPSHHGAFIRIGDIALLSASPEQFLSVSADGVIESRPIKGTRPRGATHVSDERLKRELATSEKERAENLMIVDLMRNDIARVSAVGSVEVTGLLEVESYAHVHQLVSTVRGRLAEGFSAIDAVEACFPAGSMTGAPKLRATQILDGLEQRARGIYSGAFGYFGVDGSMDLAMVIRSIVLDAGGATIGSGGGITALSNPAEELAEVHLKAAALLAVLAST